MILPAGMIILDEQPRLLRAHGERTDLLLGSRKATGMGQSPFLELGCGLLSFSDLLPSCHQRNPNRAQ
jgi:hypothetical protein